MQGPDIGYVYRDAPDHFSYSLSIICQYKKDTPCFKDSDEGNSNKKFKFFNSSKFFIWLQGKLNAGVTDDMKSLGVIKDQEYFIGSVQVIHL